MPRHDNLRESLLPKCRQWEQWLAHWWDQLGDIDEGWGRLLRDTMVALHHNISNCARRLRNNPGWDIQGTMRDDTINLHEEAQGTLAHFQQNHRREDIPVRFLPLFDFLDGALRQQVRLAREVEELRRTGSLDLHVTTDRHTATLIESA